MSRASVAYARQFLELMQKPDIDLDRGAVAGDFDRTEDDLEEPALDRRHGDRDLRLSAAVVRAGRRPLLARHRAADRKPDREPNGRCGSWPWRKARGSTSWRQSCAAGKANTGRSWQGSAATRLPAREDRRRDYTRSTRRPPSTRRSSTISRSWSTALLVLQRRARQPVGRFSIETALQAGRWPAVLRGRGKRRTHDVLGQVRLPGLRLHHRRDRAAAVLLQQPVRRLPGLRRSGHRDVFRPGPGRAGSEASACDEGAVAPWANSSSQYYEQTLESLSRHYKVSDHRAVPRPAEKGAREVVLFGSGARTPSR